MNTLRSRILFVIAVCALALVSLDDFAPQNEENLQVCEYQNGWSQIQSNGFVLVYPNTPYRYFTYTLQLNEVLESVLLEDFARYNALFGMKLEEPIIIRTYPDEDTYTCLNPASNQVSFDGHAHVGEREIAFIRTSTPQVDSTQTLQSVRYEYVALLVLARTDRQAPPGLVAGIADYAKSTFASPQNLSIEAEDWVRVWEDRNTAADPVAQQKANSIVAFLLDFYGWSKFNDLLDRLADNPDYEIVLRNVYGKSLEELVLNWLNYYPEWEAERWQTHWFYQYDIEIPRGLIESSAYTQAVVSIEEVTPILALFSQNETLAQLELLREQAKIGLDGDQYLNAARSSLIAGEYSNTITLLDEAVDRYAQIDASHRVDEIEAYREHAINVLSLRAELELMQEDVVGNPLIQARISSIGEELATLGDEFGRDLASSMLDLAAVRQQLTQRVVFVIGVLILIGLLIFRIMAALKPVPPEVDLL